MPQFDKSLVWFRRDLRHTDHAALYYALTQSQSVWCVFVFDTDILDALKADGVKQDRRVDFLLASVAELDEALRKAGGGLIVLHGSAATCIPDLAAELGVQAVFANTDYEPAAIARDAAVDKALKKHGAQLLSYKDQVIFEKDEVLTQSAKPFSVFTPYKNAWMAKLAAAGGDFYLKPYPVEKYFKALAKPPGKAHHGLPSHKALGFQPSNLQELNIPTGMSGAQSLLEDFLGRIGAYGTARDFPAVKGPSYLSIHLRFGTVSIRTLARAAMQAMHAG